MISKVQLQFHTSSIKISHFLTLLGGVHRFATQSKSEMN